jgi:hypothetical protein
VRNHIISADPAKPAKRRLLLPATTLNETGDDSMWRAFLKVFKQLITIIPGEPWANTD